MRFVRWQVVMIAICLGLLVERSNIINHHTGVQVFVLFVGCLVVALHGILMVYCFCVCHAYALCRAW